MTWRKLSFWAAALSLAVAPGISAQTYLDLPLGIGLRVPQYDRVNGLSLPWGPVLTVDDERFKLDPVITYRSHLGKLDPSVRMQYQFDSIFSFRLTGERGTYSNDRWFREDFLNSLWSFMFGDDVRNYYRADLGKATFLTRLARENLSVQLSASAQVENAWSTGWRAGEEKEPFSIIRSKNATNGMRRPNPEIDKGRIPSAIFETEFDYTGSLFISKFSGKVEYGWDGPNGGKFTQFTLSQGGKINTVAGQQLEYYSRLVTTTGNPTPGQRLVYLGGSGTLPTIDLLSRGGDRLIYLDTWYKVPLPFIYIPFMGEPYIAPRFVTGAVGTRQFERPTQNGGVRVGLGFLWLEYMRDLDSKKNVLSSGFAIPM